MGGKQANVNESFRFVTVEKIKLQCGINHAVASHSNAMSLPIYTDTDDVNSLVEYLRNKPTGATITEAKAVLQKVLDKRKVSAYLSWNIIVRDGERIKFHRVAGN